MSLVGGPPARPHPDGDRLAARPSRRSRRSTASSSTAKAKRVLFLVDRGNLGRQALKEFQQYVTPDDGRKFTELYNVQLLTSNKHRPGRPRRHHAPSSGSTRCSRARRLDPELEEASAFTLDDLRRDPVPVAYNPAIPVETFDFIWTDECHRSHLQPLAPGARVLRRLPRRPHRDARRSRRFGFFNQNLVMEYGHEQAVADGVQRRLRRLPDPDPDHRAGRDGRGRALRRQARPRHPRRPLGEARRGPHLRGDRPRPRRGGAWTRSGPWSGPSGTGSSPRSSPAAREVPKTLIFAKDDSPRRRHRPDRPRGVRPRATSSARRSPTGPARPASSDPVDGRT